MQIVHPQDSTVDYAPFNPLLKSWFAQSQARGGLPDKDEALRANDPLAGHRMIAAITPEPLSVQYEEVGAALELLYGHPMAGKNLNELYNDWFRKRAYEGYRKCAAQCLPVYERRSFASAITRLGYYKLHLPYGAGRAATHAFTYILPMSPDVRTRADWERIVRLMPWF